MWNKLKYIIKIIFVVSLLLIIFSCILTIFWLYYTHSGKQKLQLFLNHLLQQQINLKINYSKLKVSFFPPGLVLTDLKVINSKGKELLISDIEAYLNLFKLAFGKIEFSEIELVRPIIYIKIVDGKLIDFPQLKERPLKDEALAKEKFSFLKEIGLIQGKLILEIIQNGIPIKLELKNTDIDISRGEGDQFEIRFNAKDSIVKIKGEKKGVTSLSFRLSLKEEDIYIRNLTLLLEDANLNINLAHYNTGAKDGSAELDFYLPLYYLNLFDNTVGRFSGKLRGNLKISSFSDPEISGEFYIANFAIKDHKIGNVNLRFKNKTKNISIHELRIERPESSGIITSNNIDISLSEGFPLKAELYYTNVEFANLIEDFGLKGSRVKFLFSGKSVIEGTLTPLKLTGTTELNIYNYFVLLEGFREPKNETILYIPKSSLTTKLDITKEGVYLNKINIRMPYSNIYADSFLSFSNYFEVKVKESKISLNYINSIAGLIFKGDTIVTSTIKGPYSSPLITATGRIKQFVLENISFGWVLHFDLRYRDRLLSIINIKGEYNDSNYHVAKIELNFREKAGLLVDGEAETGEFWWHDFLQMFNITNPYFKKVDAKATGKIKISFNRKGKPHWLVKPQLTLSEISLVGEIFQTGKVNLQYLDGNLIIDSLELYDKGSLLTINGNYLNEEFDLKVELKDYSLAYTDLGFIPKDKIDTTLNSYTTISGTEDHLKIDSLVNTTPIIYNSALYPPLKIEWHSVSKEYTLKVTSVDRRIDIIIGGLLSKEFPIKAKWNIKEVELSPIIDIAKLSHLKITTNGEINTELKQWETDSWGYISINKIDGSYDKIGFNFLKPINLNIQKGVYYIENWAQFNIKTLYEELTTATSFLVGGSFSTKGPNLKFKGKVNLDFLKENLSFIKAITGEADLDLSIEGSWHEILLLGKVDLNLPYLGLTYLDTPIEDIKGELLLNRGEIIIKEIKAKLMEGFLITTGSLLLKGVKFERLTLNILLRDIMYRPGNNSYINFDSDLLLSYSKDEKLPLLGGDVWLNKVKYGETFDLGAELFQVGKHKIDIVEAYNPEKDHIKIRLNIFARNPIIVDNNLLELKIGVGNMENRTKTEMLKIEGTDQRYGILGSLYVYPDGFIYWRDVQFRILRGVIELESTYHLDPYFDIFAVTQRRDWTIYLTIRGTKSDFEIKTYSEPTLSDDDIMLLLTIGLTRQEIEQLGIEQGVTSFISEILFNAVSGGKTTKTFIPIMDEFKLTSEYSPRTGKTEPRIKIGKKITPKLKTTATTGLTSSRDFKANIEFNVTDNLSIEGNYDNDNDSQIGNIGTDIKFRLEF